MPALPEGTVTFLITDIEGSTRLLQQLGERYGDLLQQHHELVRSVVQELDGYEVECSGDGFVLVFARADDAVRAAVRIQQGLAALPPTPAGTLRVRMGVHTGQPELSASGYVGLDVHRAARIGDAGHGGQILLSQSARELVERELPDGVSVRDLGEHRLKDLPRPEHVFQLDIGGLRDEFPPLRSLIIRPNNLPGQLTNFIGREHELDDAKAALSRSRLLSLTGPGGTGKTRFALELAGALIDEFEDGAYFIDLAPVFDPHLVISTVGQVLGVPDVQGRPPLEHLKDYLRDKRLLLILDNFEQVLSAGPELAELLTACSMVRALVTSRVALRVSGEQELQVPPLALPDPGQLAQSGDDLATKVIEYEAIRLFVERARAVQADFRLTDESAAAVAEICRRLDGLPLAIELAAARVRLLPPRAMLGRLASAAAPAAPAATTDAPPQSTSISPLQFLTGGARDLPSRHQTLRATIAWSYNLLEPAEQALFRRLAVFVGGFTLEAAEAAASAAAAGDRRWALAADETLDGVESLIAKNLMRSTAGSDAIAEEPRFTMLETIREFGLQQLAEAGELRSMRSWHAGYYVQLAERAEPLLRGPEQRAWLDRLEADHDNLRAALEWSLAEGRDGEAALRLCGALAWFWWSRAYATEGRRWMARALTAGPARAPARVKTLNGAGWLAHIQRDAAAAQADLECALLLGRELGDQWAVAWSLHLLGRVAYYENDAVTARELGEQSLAAARASGDPYMIAWSLHLLALAAHIAADYATAWNYYEQSRSIREQLGYREGVGICLSLMSMVAYRRGDFEAARTLGRDGLRELRAVGAFWTANNTLGSFAAMAARLGQPKEAVRLAGAAHAFGEATHVNPIPLTQAMLEETLDIARSGLSDREYDEEWAAGQAMSLDEAIAEALSLELELPNGAPDEMSPATASPAGLSPREQEVLRLIAQGRTSKEIAEALIISVPTVERHITHIYTKIGARGRAEATAFALRHGLTT